MGGVNFVGRHGDLAPTTATALCTDGGQAGDRPLLNQLAFHFCDRREDVKQKSPGGCRGVEAVGQRAEVDLPSR